MKLLLPVAAASFAVLTLAGCHVSHSGSGDKNNVSIATPFGSMNVKTHDGGDATTGLTVYPGATPAKDSDNNNAADVNLNFGNFHVGINAASYMTGDAPAKVIAFYKSDMAHFGDVIECQDKKPIGTPARTSQGLTCDDQDKNDIHTGSVLGNKDEIELRVGSPSSQHVVGVRPKDGGTHIGLVQLNLPSPSNSHDAE